MGLTNKLSPNNVISITKKKNICLKGTTQIKAQSILFIQHSYAIQV